MLHRYIDKRKQFEEYKKKIAELESNMATKADLLKMIEDPLNKLGDSSPPAALDIPDLAPFDTQVGGSSECKVVILAGRCTDVRL